MNEESISKKVESPRSFWRNIQTWLRILILVTGWVVGGIILFPVWGLVGPTVLLIALNGSGTFALVTEILLVLGLLVSAFAVLVVFPWLTFMVFWWNAAVGAKFLEASRLRDFIFRK